jgi:hypothetical protein
MIGWEVAWKCLVACLFLDESQQPTWPQIRHMRRCTQRSPVWRQSSQPLALGVTCWIWSVCVQAVVIDDSFIWVMGAKDWGLRLSKSQALVSRLQPPIQSRHYKVISPCLAPRLIASVRLAAPSLAKIDET